VSMSCKYEMNKKLKKNASRGAILIEFAIVLPLLLLMLAGIVDLGSMLFRSHELARAAREGAVQASRETNPAFPSSRDAILNSLGSSSTNPGWASIQIVGDGSFPATGSTVTVTITYNYDHPIFFPFNIVPQALTIQATARHE
jgi:Flp pilus assembly protein TadG